MSAIISLNFLNPLIFIRRNHQRGWIGVFYSYGFPLISIFTFAYVIISWIQPDIFNLEDNSFLEFCDPYYNNSFQNGAGGEEQVGCHLPKVNPFHPFIMNYIKIPHSVNCSSGPYQFPIIFDTDLDSKLIMKRNPKNYGLSGCCYKNFRRITDWKSISSETCYPITKNRTHIPEPHEFIAIYCENTNTSNTRLRSKLNYILVDILPIIHVKTALESSSKSKSDGKKLNVVILGLDSVSHMSFIRTMPLTHKYLKNKLHSISMNGYTKVGDNTFPNLVPVLTGLFEQELVEQNHLNLGDKYHYDNLPFIWKNYSEHGYLTAYGEDLISIGTYNYGRPGFNTTPTDYYLNTLTNALQKSLSYKSSELCFGPRLEFSILMENLQKFAFKMQSNLQPYFQWTWLSSLSHASMENNGLGDQEVFSTLKWFKKSGYLNNTIFIMMSDHGMRVGEFRKTCQGRIEERMPFLYFILPNWLKQEYPIATRNMKSNQNKLASPFDLYETLKDLLTKRVMLDKEILERSKHLQRKKPRGISFFLPIPLSRTCEDAQISSHFCVCNTLTTISVKDPTVVYLARITEDYLNSLLKPYPQCSKTTVVGIRSALVDLPREARNKSAAGTYTLIVETVPGDALFEVTLTKDRNSYLWDYQVSSDISRLNFYGNKSYCVGKAKIKKYCYCYSH